MPLPCNNVSVTPIKVSQLVRYKNIDTDDFFLTIESGSGLYSRKSTFGDLVDALGNVTGSYTGSFSGSFKGKASGSFSGSYWGSVISKNTNATGSFKGNFKGDASGSFSGSILSKNTKATGSFYGNKSTISGSFSGSFYGSLLSKNTKASGSFYGNKSTISGSFSGSFYGSLLSKNTKASGSFSGSHYGSLLSKNTIASGSFSGSHYGSLLSKNTIASGSFSGSHYGKVIGSKGSLITGSFRGIDNITNFKGTGKKVSFNGTASYAISASYTGGPARLFHVFTRPAQTTGTPPSNITVSVTKPSGATWYDFEVFLSSNARTNNGLSLEGIINFNTSPLTGTSVSQQYDAGSMPNTGIGNVTQVWEGTVDNDSCLCRWEHTGLVPSVISSTNTLSFICGVNALNGGYDGNGYQVSGLKASYYF